MIVGTKGRFLIKRLRIKTPASLHARKRSCRLLVDLVAPLKGYDHVSIGFPGYVRDGKVFTAPNLGTKAWTGFDLARRHAKESWESPTRLNNDADVQGLAVIRARGWNWSAPWAPVSAPPGFAMANLLPHMELAHMAIHHKDPISTFISATHDRKKIGNKEWNKRVKKLIAVLATVMNYDQLYLGGGNSQRIKFRLPSNVSIVSNDAGMEGGAFVWHPDGPNAAKNPQIGNFDASRGVIGQDRDFATLGFWRILLRQRY